MLQFPVNDICNSRCQMCNIWQQKRSLEISPSDVRKILSNRLFRYLRSVGLNGGEPTLRKDLAEVARAVTQSLPHLRSLSLITNALSADRVIERIAEVGAVCQENRVALDVMVSLDGIGVVHDRVRGRSGNFSAASRVLEWLEGSGLVDSYRVGCTIVRDNVFDLENVLAWCRERNYYVRFRLAIPHQRLYSLDVIEPFSFDPDEVFHLANFLDLLYYDYEKDFRRRQFYLGLRNQIVYGKKRSTGCAWKHAGATLSSRGELSYCAVASKFLGSALVEDSHDLYWSNRDHLDEITRTRCDRCLHDYDGDASRLIFARFVVERILSCTPKLFQRLAEGAYGVARQVSETRRILGVVVAQGPPARPKPKPTRSSNRVLVCGWYGTETLGDQAILAGVLQCLRQVFPSAQVDLASLEPYVSHHTWRLMPELGLERVLSLSQALTDLRRREYRAVVMAGGPLMAGVGEVIHMLELFTVAASTQTATMLAGCGIGPLDRGPRTWAIARLLKIVDEVVLRDRTSVLLAETLSPRARAPELVLDPAFLWLQDQCRRSPAPARQRRIGLALRDWPLKQYGHSLGNRASMAAKHRFDAAIPRLVRALQEREPGVEILPFCMNKLAVGGDDRFYYRRVLGDFPEVLANLDNCHRSPYEELARLRTCAVMLTMRFHGLVFAIATGTPATAVDYTCGGKVASLVADVAPATPLVSPDLFEEEQVSHTLLSLIETQHEAPNELICTSRKTLTEAFGRLFYR